MSETLKKILLVAGILLVALLITRLLPDFGTPPARAESPGTTTAPESFTPAEPLDLNNLQVLQRANEEFADLCGRVVPSVVSINTRKTLEVPRVYLSPFGYVRRFEEEEQPAGLGSGVFVSREGHVITNHHVIDGVDGIEVITSNGERFPARLIGSDPDLDIAVLVVEGAGEERKFPALTFGDSAGVRVGETVLAVGNPFGLSETVTRGIISARDRQLSDTSNELFQTDTVINPGNSGGPLLNVRGEIIGINVSIYAGQREVRVWQGVGFAIPADAVKRTFDAIMRRGRPVYGYLGVRVQETPVEGGGILIAGIEEGSPAAAAGLVAGDIVISIHGRPVRSGADLVRRVAQSGVGQKVPLTILRGEDRITVEAVVEERPSETRGTAPGAPPSAQMFGVQFRDFTAAERKRLGMAPDSPGVLVTGVTRNSPLASALRPGDIVIQLNQMPVTDLNTLTEQARNLPPGQQAFLYLVRSGQRAYVRFFP